jgi:hypothetical protein
MMDRPKPMMNVLPSNSFVRLGHFLVRLGFGVAVMVFFAAPIYAISWRQKPFPGFFLEQTLVVNENRGENWTGQQAGIVAPQQVIRVNGIFITSIREFDAIMAGLDPTQTISVFTLSPEYKGTLYPEVALTSLTDSDFIRFFWLPYLIGLIYLGIGVWIYRARGGTYAGLALTIFCGLTSVICGMIFDLSTTHVAPGLWITAVSMSGASLISLAMCFPQEWGILKNRTWILVTPYLVSILLMFWNMRVLMDARSPWSYFSAWGASYRFLAFGILLFIGTLIFQDQRSSSQIIRRQARIVLLGSVLAFLPLIIWFLAPVLKMHVEFNVVLFLPPLVLFPISIGIAILRYRLLEIDAFVNRTIVYGLLTAILAGLFTAMIRLSQKLFVVFTGEESDAAIIIATLIVGAAIAPIRSRLQDFVDRKFKDLPDHTRGLQAFGDQVQNYIQMNKAELLTQRLLTEAARAVHAESGAVSHFNGHPGKPELVHTYKRWNGNPIISLPIEADGIRYGLLMLGPRLGGKPYTQQEYDILKQVSNQIAAAIYLNTKSPQDHTFS